MRVLGRGGFRDVEWFYVPLIVSGVESWYSLYTAQKHLVKTRAGMGGETDWAMIRLLLIQDWYQTARIYWQFNLKIRFPLVVFYSPDM